MSKVLISEATYDNCRLAVDRAFEAFPIQVEGKKVLVKPNALRECTPESGMTTHPAVLRAVVEKLESLGAKRIIVGDNPGMNAYGANEETFRSTGLMAASGGHYRNIGTDAVSVDFNPRFVDKVLVSREIMEADVVISLPKFKTHGLTTVTVGVKNSYGILPGAQKQNLHRASGDPFSFAEMLVDLYQKRVPDLFIVDAVVGMEGNGPASPDLRQLDRIMAADNGIALDAICAYMMGVEPADVSYLSIAAKQGLGEIDVQKIDVLGQLERIPYFKTPTRIPPTPGSTPGGHKSPNSRAGYASRVNLRPQADASRCTACAICVDMCPAEALELFAVPVVDEAKCLTCFCCQEMCPHQAIQLVP